MFKKIVAPITFGSVEGGVIGAVATAGNVDAVLIGALLGLLTSTVIRIGSELFFYNKTVPLPAPEDTKRVSKQIYESPFTEAAKKGELPVKRLNTPLKR